jgi:SulP family sulfate permease
VSVATFDWHSLRTLPRMPLSETAVMVSTVAVVLVTHNLAIGVGVGVLVACVLFARRVAHLVEVTAATDAEGARVYSVHGAMFFASSNDLVHQFDYAGDPENVVIDLSDAHVWDASTVAALDAITHKYETRGKRVRIIGLNEHSSDRYQRHTGQLAGGV